MRFAIVGLTAFSTIALHGITALGCGFLLLAVILGIQSLHWWFAGTAPGGFPTVILLQLIVGSVIMIALGIIGEYLAGIYYEVKGRPRYIVSETHERGSDE